MEAGLPYDHDSLRAKIDALRAKQIFFIGAMPKSGTTWLQRMLDAHPEVSCIAEGHFPNALMPRIKTLLEQHNAMMKYKSDVALEGLGNAPFFSEAHLHHLTATSIALLLLASSDDTAVRAVGEKTPDNLLHFPLLSILFPRAKFVTIVRDPRDCAISAWFHNLRIGSPELGKRFKTMESFIDFVAEQWAKAVSYSLKLRQAEPDRLFMLRYEDLLEAPEARMTEAFQFLGVSATPGIVRPCIDQGAFETMSGGRPAGTEERGAFLRKGKAGDWRNHLNAEAQARILKIAGMVMTLLAYS